MYIPTAQTNLAYNKTTFQTSTMFSSEGSKVESHLGADGDHETSSVIPRNKDDTMYNRWVVDLAEKYFIDRFFVNAKAMNSGEFKYFHINIYFYSKYL